MKLLPNNKQQIASFDVDAQKTFTPICPDELPVPEGDQIVPELNANAALATYRIGSKDAHSPNADWVETESAPQGTPIEGDNMDIRWKPHAVPATVGFELLDGLPHVTAYDFFVWTGMEPDMHPYGNCYHDFNNRLSTGVIEFLSNRGVTHVIVGGLATNYCVCQTVLQLSEAGFKVVLNLAACRGTSENRVAEAIVKMEQIGVVTVPNAAALVT